MTGQDKVAVIQALAHPSRDCLLTDTEMHWTTHLLFRIQVSDGLLDHPDPQHSTQEFPASILLNHHGMNQK